MIDQMSSSQVACQHALVAAQLPATLSLFVLNTLTLATKLLENTETSPANVKKLLHSIMVPFPTVSAIFLAHPAQSVLQHLKILNTALLMVRVSMQDLLLTTVLANHLPPTLKTELLFQAHHHSPLVFAVPTPALQSPLPGLMVSIKEVHQLLPTRSLTARLVFPMLHLNPSL
jgi:hypothetical protein